MLDLTDELEKTRKIGLWRVLKRYKPIGPVTGELDGRPVINFAANDYLGFSFHPKLRAAAAEALSLYGAGGTASRLVSGDNVLYQELEAELARLKGCEAALIFPTGYQANIGVIKALAKKGDVIYTDRLSHASLIDGCLLSGAEIRRYHHNDLKILKKWLAGTGSFRRRFIVTDTVFSMDGDLAPLPELSDLAKRYQAILLVDDAHGTGVLGDKGAGAVSYLGAKDVPVQIGTLSKALGCLGGFVSGSGELMDLLVNKSRPLIFSTALPPSVLAAAFAAVRLLKEEPVWQKKLTENIDYMRRVLSAAGVTVSDDPTPILPIVIGDADAAVRLSLALLDAGFLAPAIRPPAVPPGGSRLRITVSACHTKEQIDGLMEALMRVTGNG